VNNEFGQIWVEAVEEAQNRLASFQDSRSGIRGSRSPYRAEKSLIISGEGIAASRSRRVSLRNGSRNRGGGDPKDATIWWYFARVRAASRRCSTFSA
jgi:hypothetical protein